MDYKLAWLDMMFFFYVNHTVQVWLRVHEWPCHGKKKLSFLLGMMRKYCVFSEVWSPSSVDSLCCFHVIADEREVKISVMSSVPHFSQSLHDSKRGLTLKTMEQK